MTVNTLVMTPHLIKGTRFDPVKDFAPVAPVALGSLALVARSDFEARSVPALVALAKSAPGRLNYGSPGNGTPHHLAMELLKARTGVDIVHVPYKGSANLMSDILGRQVDVAFLPVHQVLPQVRSGKLLMLASGGDKRASVTPEVPCLREASGIPDIDVDMWYGLYLPAGTPPEILDAANREVNQILKLKDVADALQSQGLTPTGGSRAELAEITRRDYARWGSVIRAAKLQVD
jgi:tripartite-type tricarboxylate transporter receptor subunit TctC